MYFDNLLALWISINYGVLPEKAMHALDYVYKYGAYPRKNDYKWNDEDYRDMKKLLGLGMTAIEIGKMYNIRTSKVLEIVERS